MSKIRKSCFDYWRIDQGGRAMLPCHCDDCVGALFDPAITEWEAAHMVARANGGSNEPPNVRPMVKKHHRYETHTKDVPQIAKGKRVSAKHHGIKRKRGFYRPKGVKYNWQTGRHERV